MSEEVDVFSTYDIRYDTEGAFEGDNWVSFEDYKEVLRQLEHLKSKELATIK